MPFTPRLVFVTAPNLEEARTLAEGILKKHLAACVNLVAGLESHYWWQDKLDKADEVLLLIKSSEEQFEALAEHIRWHHSYECPEIVAVAPQEISPEYRAWWAGQSSSQGPADSGKASP
jgi:periplasmic divalent cation tolerance protein